MSTVLNNTMPTAIEAWSIPKIGRASDSDVPEWLVTQWLSKKVRMNGYGGFTQDTEQGELVCYAGDEVLLMSDQSIQFRRTGSTHTA